MTDEQKDLSSNQISFPCSLLPLVLWSSVCPLILWSLGLLVLCLGFWPSDLMVLWASGPCVIFHKFRALLCEMSIRFELS